MAKAIDVGEYSQSSGLRTIDSSGEDSGYIVSRRFSNTLPYWNNRNWTLVLTGIHSSKIEILFENFDIQEKVNGICVDYLFLTSSKKICEPQSDRVYLSLLASEDLTFTFVTDGSDARMGFWLQYKGNHSHISVGCSCCEMFAELRALSNTTQSNYKP